jgi:hypothetical protein
LAFFVEPPKVPYPNKPPEKLSEKTSFAYNQPNKKIKKIKVWSGHETVLIYNCCRLSACSPRVRERNQLETFVFQSKSISLPAPHHTAVGYRYYPG